MNDNERNLLRTVAEGDIRKAQDAARVILNGIPLRKTRYSRQIFFGSWMQGPPISSSFHIIYGIS